MSCLSIITFKFGGTYKGDLPVSVATTVKVNGEPVEANQGYNLNGDVEITYTATNNTSKMQDITFTDVFGETKTKSVDIPVPFGDSFAATFGDGWDVIDTGTGTKKTTGDGTVVSATMILFPVLAGVMGGTTQSVTIKARADNANLPSANHTVVPIQLQDYQDGSLLTLAPQAESKIIEPAAGLLGQTVDEVLLATHIISGYTSGFRKLDADYIDPLVADVQKLNVNPKSLNGGLTQLANGLTDLGVVLEGDAEAKGIIAGVVLQISNYIGKNLTDTIEWLTAVIKKVGPDAGAAAKSLASIDQILQDLDIEQLNTDNQAVAAMCATVGKTATSFGGNSPFFPGTNNNPTSRALIAAIKAVSGTNKKTLQDLQGKLKDQGSKVLRQHVVAHPKSDASGHQVHRAIGSV